MGELIRWALLTLGLVYFTTESVLFSVARVALARRGGVMLETLLYCPACSGFWLGLATSWAWPGDVWWLRLIESAIAGMALGALWSAAHSNPMWGAEAPLRDPTTTLQEREEDHE